MAANNTNNDKRNTDLDTVKGLLVIGMLVIHSSNMFMDSVAVHRVIYPTLLGFVSGSWLFISGLLVGLRYHAEFSSRSSIISRRLIDRGWRLVAIFVVSNIALGRLDPGTCFQTMAGTTCNLIDIFVRGNGAQAFEVLLGIGYLLVISPILLYLPKKIRTAAVAIAIAGLSTLSALGIELPMLSWMLACGFAGLITGTLPGFGHLIQTPMRSGTRALAATAAFSVWTASQLIYKSDIISFTSPVIYIPHIMSALALLYLAAPYLAQVAWMKALLKLMAHYSLLAYVGQMAILKSWYQATVYWPAGRMFLIAITVSALLMLAGLHAIDGLRVRYRLVDKLYRSTFG